jgi:hypothetical protein
MKTSTFLLIAIFSILSSRAFAETTADDSATEAVSVSREVACKSGFCPAPVDSKQATLVDRMRSKQLVDWIMNDGTGAPPEITNSETHR